MKRHMSAVKGLHTCWLPPSLHLKEVSSELGVMYVQFVLLIPVLCCCCCVQAAQGAPLQQPLPLQPSPVADAAA